MLRIAIVAALGLAAAAACRADVEFGGQVRPQWIDQQPSARSPLARADAIDPGIVALPATGAIVETELRASGHGLATIVTLQAQRFEGRAATARAIVNELYGSADAVGWQFSAGKKIVAWDVGYAFRPNDFVEQETRRTLLSVTPEGRPVVTAEHFDANTAWALVLVNPSHARADRGAEEPALAARVYQRDGAVDWHGFARLGVRTGASLGAAAAWVACDSLEMHGSARWLARADALASDAAPGALLRANPWQDASVRHTAQLLAGGTWTNVEQVSLLAEAWWDGTALSNGQWDDWNARNRQLGALVGSPAPLPAIAGNLAWQANAFAASSSLRRANLYARLSWQYDKWQPEVDMLYTPADAGRIVSASLGWQGDRVRVDGGVRVYGGPGSAVLAQMPTRRIVYLAGTWSF
ncbi:MAG: hypothetical protein ABJA61_02105 [Caldimonas sp.]